VEFNPKTAKAKTRPSPVTQTESSAEYDLFVVNQKVPFLTLTITSENPWLVELAHRSGKVFTVGMNPATGRVRGSRKETRSN